MSKLIKVLFVFGTRPEVIKMAPVIKECRKHKRRMTTKVCISGQHRQMIDPLLELFAIRPDYDLNIMRANQNLEYITTSVLQEVGKIIELEKIDCLVVQGDTTTVMAAALAAFYKGIKIVHVEAGLRTWDKDHPFPEEANRKIIDSVTDIFLAHTKEAKQNLLNEGVKPKSIEVTGNTVIDALLDVTQRPFDVSALPVLSASQKIILVTAHRRENFGRPIENVCQAIKQVAARFDDVVFVYPVHLNPNIQTPVRKILNGIKNVILTEPMEYLPFSHLMKKCHLVLTDSGGLQEEAPSLGKPVLVLRQTTERPEGVKAGCVEVVGTQTATIVRKLSSLLRDKKKYLKMSRTANPYGDGKASIRIIKRLLKEFC